MGLDLWFRDDVRRILRALASSGNQHGPEYLEALRDVGIAFGLDEPQVGSQEELLASWEQIPAATARY